MIDARLASVSIFISRLDFYFWWVDRFSFYRGWLAYTLLRVISSDHMYFSHVMVFSLISQTFLTTGQAFSPPMMMMTMMWLILFRSVIPDSLARVLLWPAVSTLSFVFCLLAVYPLGLFVCLCSLSIFSLSIIIMLTFSFRRWRSCNPDVFMLKVSVSLVYPVWKSNPLVSALKSSLKMV